MGGAILSSHSNVINPPWAGSWCGDFPTIFRQIEILEECQFNLVHIPNHVDHFEFLVGNDSKNGLAYKDGTFYIPYLYWKKQFSRRFDEKQIDELSCCFVDDVYFYEGDNNSRSIKILNGIVSCFVEKTKARIGEVSIFILDNEYYFRYALSRPILNSFNGTSRYKIIEEIYKQLSVIKVDS